MASSAVWQYFKKISTKEAQCQTCHVVLQCKDGQTTSLIRHMSSRHNIIVPKTNKRNAAAGGDCTEQQQQPKLKQFIANNSQLNTTSKRYQDITKKNVKMLVIDLQPLSVVTDKGFRELLNFTEPRYTIPSRKTFRNKILPLAYQEASCRLKDVIKQSELYSITTDGWTSRSLTSYITYTLHVVNMNFSMLSFVIGTYRFSEQHTALHLKMHLVKTLKEWDIIPSANEQQHLPPIAVIGEADCHNDDDAEDVDSDFEDSEESVESLDVPEDLADIPEKLLQKIVITTDNASNISKAVKDSGLLHIRCFAHSINLAVQKAVVYLNPHIARVRKLVAYFHRSSLGTSELQVKLTSFANLSD